MRADQLNAAANDAIARRDFDHAMQLLRDLIQLNPSDVAALNLLAAVQAEVDQPADAAATYAQSLARDANQPETLTNRAIVLYRLGKDHDAVEHAWRSLALREGDARTHMVLAEALLRSGNLTEGFDHYEWRTRLPEYARFGRADLPRPRWNGQDLNGKTLLIHAEQGLGDVIQVVRYIPLLAQQGASIVLECDASLVQLLSRVTGVSEVLPRANVLPGFDFHVPSMSLPRAFGGTIPANVPYIRTDRSHPLRSRGRKSAGARTIGLCWSGGPHPARRNLPARLLNQLSDIPDVEFVSLQLPAPHVEPLRDLPAIDMTSELRDFDDTAALIAELDLVISVDTAVAHLAGAMGKPAWLLLPFAPEWRWKVDGPDSPWYPTMRIFRQPTPGDWDSVVHQVRDALVQNLPTTRP